MVIIKREKKEKGRKRRRGKLTLVCNWNMATDWLRPALSKCIKSAASDIHSLSADTIK